MKKSTLEEIKESANKEISRMAEIFESIKVHDVEKAKEFHDFAKNYFDDGKWFFEKEKYIEAFEAAVIAWAYIDAGLKLGFFSVPKELKVNFTIDK